MNTRRTLLIILLALLGTNTLLFAQNFVGLKPELAFLRDNGHAPGGGPIQQVEAGDALGTILFKGFIPGLKYVDGAAIRAYASGPIASGLVPSSLSFQTGSPEMVSRMYISKDGLIGINNDQPSARLAVQHFATPAAAGIPSFEIEGGSEIAPRKFSIFNDGSSALLRARLQGHMQVEEGNVVVTQGNIVADRGDIKAERGNIFLPMGKVVIGDDMKWKEGNHKMYVNGSVLCTEVKIAHYRNWPDYVFNEDYSLMPLRDLEIFIVKNGHLPDMPTAAEVSENGMEMMEMQKKLLEKIEELTLYILAQQREIEALKNKVKK